MKIFFVTYWGVKDGLSVATSQPNLRLLSTAGGVDALFYFTVERAADSFHKNDFQPITKVQHLPIISQPRAFHLLTKAMDWVNIRSTILQKIKEEKPDFIICRGAMAGVFGYFAYKKYKTPFYVESFEPHAAYMLESGVWGRRSPKYMVEHYLEQKIKQHAAGIITVSNGYRSVLIKEGLSAHKVFTVPCYVPLDKFVFDGKKRDKYRSNIKATANQKVGVYLGKFGGMYYDDEAFECFRQAFNFYKENFFLLLLTPSDPQPLYDKLEHYNIPKTQAFIVSVPHHEVPGYLSAADFAYSFHIQTPSKIALSPIKHGEYWAMGLPFITADNIGDDSSIIQEEGGGAIADFRSTDSIKNALKSIHQIIEQPNYRQNIRKLAEKHRHITLQKQVYEAILEQQIASEK